MTRNEQSEMILGSVKFENGRWWIWTGLFWLAATDAQVTRLETLRRLFPARYDHA